jgi:hypothetical protein
VRRHSPKAVALAAAIVVGTVACGDDPFAFNWSDRPDTVQIYSLARPEQNVQSAFNFYTRSSLDVSRPSSTGNWDLAVDTDGDDLVLLPPGALGVASRARIAAIEGMTLDDIVEAPTDTLAYVGADPVPVRLGTIYVVRTGQRTGSFGTRCVYYAKMEAVEVDVPGGRLRFRHVTNPVCNDRRLTPPN